MTSGARFCTSADGTRIAYSTFGHGRPLVLIPAWLMSPEADRARLIGRDFWNNLPAGFRTISYDRRGIGMSQRDVAHVSLERQVEDVAALVDHLRLGTFDLWCFHDAAAVGATFAAQFPGRVERMILYNPWANVPGVIARKHIEVWTAIIRADWGLASRCFGELLYPKGPLDAQESSTKAIRETQAPGIAEKYIELTNTYDVRDVLSKLTMPSLVVSRQGPGRTPFIPMDSCRRVAALMPGARFIALQAPAVCPYFEYFAYRGLVAEFLSDSTREAPLDPALTKREIEVLGLVAHGKTNAEIAALLGISPNTADRHLSNILAKTGSSNRAEAVLYAARHALVG